MSDLDDEELEATRRLNGVAKMSDIEKDIKRCEQLTKPEHANWIGISNQLAIAHVVDRVKELEAKTEIKQIVDKIPIEEIEERIKIDIMSEEAFNELIDNFEVVETLTEYGRKAIKQNVKKLQKRIKELEEENKKLKAKIDVTNWQEKTAYESLKERYITKQKAKDILQKNRNELFSITYVDPKQYEPYEKQIERINKIETELLKGE